MKKLLLASAVATALATPLAAWAQAKSPHTVTGNVGFATDYRFRGISQTLGNPALQGGFDYSHASGMYAGTWASNVYGGNTSQALGTVYNQGSLEWDVYGGYKFEPFKDVSADIGMLMYLYPGAKYPQNALIPTAQTKYNNTELYGSLGYKWFTAKYSWSLTDYFGINNNTVGGGNTAVTGGCGISGNNAAGGGPTFLASPCAGVGKGGSKGSSYLDLGATFDIGNGINLGLHYGKLSVKNYGLFNYSDYKISLSKDWVGFTWTAAYIDSNAKAEVYRTARVNSPGNPAGSRPDTIVDTSKGVLVLQVAKTF